MQVDINLLPEKKSSISTSKKKMVLILAVFVLGVAGMVFAQWNFSQDVSKLEKQTAALQERRNMIEAEQIETGGDRLRIIEINELLERRVQTTSVIDGMMTPLNKGTVVSVDYNESGDLVVITGFKTLEEIAIYQTDLLEITGIDQVNIVNVSREVQEIEQKDDERTKHTEDYVASIEISFNPESYRGSEGDES